MQQFMGLKNTWGNIKTWPFEEHTPLAYLYKSYPLVWFVPTVTSREGSLRAPFLNFYVSDRSVVYCWYNKLLTRLKFIGSVTHSMLFPRYRMLISISLRLDPKASGKIRFRWWPGAEQAYLTQWWPTLPAHICGTQPQWVNIVVGFTMSM